MIATIIKADLRDSSISHQPYLALEVLDDYETKRWMFVAGIESQLNLLFAMIGKKADGHGYYDLDMLKNQIISVNERLAPHHRYGKSLMLELDRKWLDRKNESNYCS